jgi:hypothetical protein
MSTKVPEFLNNSLIKCDKKVIYHFATLTGKNYEKAG